MSIDKSSHTRIPDTRRNKYEREKDRFLKITIECLGSLYTIFSHIEDIKGGNMSSISKKIVTSIVNFFRESNTFPEFKRYISHDLGNIATIVIFTLESLNTSDRNGTRQTSNSREAVINSFLLFWPRFYCATEDTALKVLASDTIDEKYCQNFDLDMLKYILDYFTNFELVSFKEKIDKQKNAAAKVSPCQKIENKQFINNINFDQLKSQLGGRRVRGNLGAVLNGVLNMLRNAFKDDIKADFIEIDAIIEEDKLVIRVCDNGIGISEEQLDSGSDKYIFASGVSATKSTGLGLANSDKRFASMGVELIVISKEPGTGNLSRFSNTSRSTFKTDLLNSMNTIFEIRLPIVQ